MKKYVHFVLILRSYKIRKVTKYEQTSNYFQVNIKYGENLFHILLLNIIHYVSNMHNLSKHFPIWNVLEEHNKGRVIYEIFERDSLIFVGGASLKVQPKSLLNTKLQQSYLPGCCSPPVVQDALLKST